MTESLLVEQHGDVAELVINRPDKRNAMTHQMWSELPALAAGLDDDPSVSVVILRSVSPGAFCAGADIEEYQAGIGDSDWSERSRSAIAGGLDSIRSMSKPTLAAIGGVCAGGGVGLAVACDIRVASHDATFTVPPARLGLVYPFAETKDLVLLIGPSQTKRLLFTGKRLTAAEALAIGFVDELADVVVGRSRSLAAEIATSSQYSVRTMKQIINLIMSGQATETKKTWKLAGDALASDDHVEGVNAFLERRTPRFTDGR